MEQASVAEHERLGALIGRWKTEGWTREAPEAPAAKIDAVDTYEWLPGGFGLLHSVDAKVGDEKVEGAEIIGYEPDRGAYVTQYFGSDGPTAYEASLTRKARASPGGCAARRLGSPASSAMMAVSSRGTGSCCLTAGSGSPGWTSR
jgi:Protein of unknown function (DUF1579)